MENGGLSASDVALMTNRGYDGWGGDGMGFMWIFALLVLAGGGFGGWGNNGFANAIGYQNLATQNDVQRGFDNLGLQDQSRDILGAVTSGTAQAVAATNQSFHDTLGVVTDKYSELQRDVAALAVGQANALANQNTCLKKFIKAIKNFFAKKLLCSRHDNSVSCYKKSGELLKKLNLHFTFATNLCIIKM